MKYQFIVLSLLLSSTFYAQEFKSTIWIEDSTGRVDSVTIGYDSSASESIDDIFGAIDITDQTWTDFEIRASQIDVTEIIYGDDVTNPRPLNELSRYQTKTEIIPKTCLSLIEVSNQSGYIPFIALFIATDSYPIKLYWQQSEFENDCVSKSVISDWPISTWGNIACCSNLEIGSTYFSGKSEIIIEKHLGMQVVNENLDTLIMLNIALSDAFTSNTNDFSLEIFENIYPNPAYGSFYIPARTEVIKICDSSGNSIAYQKNRNQIQIDHQGLVYIQLRKGTKVITQKVVNFLK